MATFADGPKAISKGRSVLRPEAGSVHANGQASRSETQSIDVVVTVRHLVCSCLSGKSPCWGMLLYMAGGWNFISLSLGWVLENQFLSRRRGLCYGQRVTSVLVVGRPPVAVPRYSNHLLAQAEGTGPVAVQECLDTSVRRTTRKLWSKSALDTSGADALVSLQGYLPQ